MSNKKKTIIFMGNPYGDESQLPNSVLNANIADNIAQKTIIYGLHEKYNEKLIVVSVAANKSVNQIDIGRGVTAEVINCNSSNRILYYLSLAKNYTIKLWEILKRLPKEEEVILISAGPYIYMAIPSIIHRIVHNVRWVPFLVGSVEIPEARFPFNIASKLGHMTARFADGVIAYVKNSATDYMPGKPFVEITYLIKDEIMNVYHNHLQSRPKKFTIAYTGALTSIYNIDIVIDVIKKTEKLYHWVFAGVGQYAKDIKDLSSDDRYDVDYLGSIENTDAAKLQMDSHLLLCLRGGDKSKVNKYYSKYAASGKLIEYLCSGTPILAGDIPGYSDTIKPFLICEKSQDVAGIVNKIKDIADNYDNALLKAKDGQDYAFNNFTAAQQNDKIYDFLESLDFKTNK